MTPACASTRCRTSPAPLCGRGPRWGWRYTALAL